MKKLLRFVLIGWWFIPSVWIIFVPFFWLMESFDDAVGFASEVTGDIYHGFRRGRE